MKILHVVGARPNFMKIAPIMKKMAENPRKYEQLLVHTGQHYDENMSQVFFNELNLPRPDVNLEVGSGSHAWQTAQVMLRFEPIVNDFKPDWILVPGDVNSTLACALVGSKLGIQIAHVEAGLRSYDRTMPEETNRIITDHLSNVLLTPSEDANENLYREGVAPEKISLVGNVMIDTLVGLLPKAKKRCSSLQEKYKLNEFVLVTLHRPSNVDNLDILQKIVEVLICISREVAVVFPLHPRTQSKLSETSFDLSQYDNLRLLPPLGYLDFLALQHKASLVITDSGGVQEETSYLGTPCLTLRSNTERPVTIKLGTNRLVDPHLNRDDLSKTVAELLNKNLPSGEQIPLWDGQAAIRVLKALNN